MPNMDFGFRYDFGPRVRSTRFYADFLKPIRLDSRSAVFFEGHAAYQSAPKLPHIDLPPVSSFTRFLSIDKSRTDISAGGGYRRLITNNFLVGVNAFYDTSRIFEKWYGSGGLGLETVAVFGGDALDLSFNWYGNLISKEVLVNAFRNQGDSYDFEAGYSHGLFGDRADLRVKITGYNYYAMSPLRGWKAGVDLTTRDGLISLSYQNGHDRLSGSYHSVGAELNVAFDLEGIVRGENPFSMPEPVFRSPRNLRRILIQAVKREWHQPAAVVLLRNTPPPPPPPPPPCMTDRTVSVGPLSIGHIPGLYHSSPVPFLPVPYTCLRDDKFVAVSFDFQFDADPRTKAIVFFVTVRAPGGAIENLGKTIVWRPDQTGTAVILLDLGGFPSVGQSAFTSTAANPSSRIIDAVGAFGTNTLTFPTGVEIRFYRPKSENFSLRYSWKQGGQWMNQPAQIFQICLARFNQN
ncbi:inverse autotransporter beta domain-containing protein [Thermodesulfobacteriota bacterium]